MKKYIVMGYILEQNPDTWESQRFGGITEIEIELEDTDDIEFVEWCISIKMGFHWFEAVTIYPK